MGRSKNWHQIKFLPFLFLLALTACSVKQSAETANVDFIVPNGAVNELSETELKAFQTKDQVDSNVPDHALNDIAKQYKYYLAKGRADVCLVTERSGHHLEYARKVFKERGMPEDLANLAIVESGYRTNAVSRAGAAGAWQFMPETGLKYGLIQDNWQDDRLDPYRATEAAADYLQYLYNYFGDWPTAVAAYNSGEGKMARAKQGTGGKDFFDVKMRNEMLDEKARLRDETKNYVPRFLAVSKIMRNLPQLGFDSVKVDGEKQLIRLKAAPGTDLAALSSACAVPWKDFTIYNQHHKRSITCTNRETFIYVPGKVERLAAQYLDSHREGDFAGWKLVRLKKSSDSLAKLSKRTNIPLAKLQKANPGVNQLRNGQTLLVPENISLPKASGKIMAEKSTAPNKSTRIHKISPNETLYAIARKYRMDPADLQSYNKIRNPSLLKPGDNLAIPENTPIPKAKNYASGSIKKYTVQPKDNLWSISRKFNVSVADLKRWNKLGEENIKPGLTLALCKE